MPSKFIVYDLETTTDYLGFESFCNDLMSLERYPAIQPLGGYKDKGRDAIHVDRSTGIATVLAYSVRDDWEEKLDGDLKKVQKHGHDCQRFVFVTAAELTPSAFDRLRNDIKQTYGWEFELFDRQRIATLVENQHRDLLTRYPGIFALASAMPNGLPKRELDHHQYANFLLRQFSVWVEQYTPLLAEHKELDTFVDLVENDSTARVPVANLPEAADIAILLGESGAGKTTSLWKIAVQAATRLRDGHDDRIPVLLNLREWSLNRRVPDLLQERFEPFELESTVLRQALRAGKFLVLIDGINEVAQASSGNCGYDLVKFMADYPDNRFVVACRSADFGPGMLPMGQGNPPLREPRVYEICRLDRIQVLNYASAYGSRHGLAIENFLQRLNVGSDDAWDDKTSPLQLARIPLYLQIFLDVYKRTGTLPNNRAELLRALVDHILGREEARNQGRIDRFATELTLGRVAFRSSSSSAALRMQVGYTRELILEALEFMRRGAVLNADVTVGELWRHLLSANFLKRVSHHSVEWLHQLLRDYFLGVEFARIWRADPSGGTDELGAKLGSRAWDLACTVALSGLGEQHGDLFLLQLIQLYDENARRAFEGQTPALRWHLLSSIISATLAKQDPETPLLKRLARALPYAEVVDALDTHFRDADEDMQVVLIEAVVHLVMEHLPSVVNGPDAFGGSYRDSSIREARYQSTKAATKRASEVLRRYLRSTNELVSIQAAKGLYESDRAAAVEQLQKLVQSTNTRIRHLVESLADEWGMN
jgi:hypothetical protein